MKNLMNACVLGAALAAGSAAFAQEKVSIAEPSWNGARAIAHVMTAIINGPLGSEAEILVGLTQQPVIYAGMDKGDGSVDVHPDMWMPNWQSAWDEYIVDKQTVDHNNPYKGTSNLYVPTYMMCRLTWPTPSRQSMISGILKSPPCSTPTETVSANTGPAM